MSPVWLTAKEAMDYLKISRGTFYRLVRQGIIVRYHMQGTDEKRYLQEQLDSIMVPEEPEKEGE